MFYAGTSWCQSSLHKSTQESRGFRRLRAIHRRTICTTTPQQARAECDGGSSRNRLSRDLETCRSGALIFSRTSPHAFDSVWKFGSEDISPQVTYIQHSLGMFLRCGACSAPCKLSRCINLQTRVNDVHQ